MEYAGRRDQLMSRLRTLVEFYASRPLRPQFDPHERWYTRLVAADDHEAWLLTWLPGQGTDLHDHGGSSGAFLVLAGELTEHILARRNCAASPVATPPPPRRRPSFGPRPNPPITNPRERPGADPLLYRSAAREQ